MRKWVLRQLNKIDLNDILPFLEKVYQWLRKRQQQDDDGPSV